MAETNTKAAFVDSSGLVNGVLKRTNEGNMVGPYKIGTTTDNITDSASNLLLSDIIKSYLGFLKTNYFIYYGTEIPTNIHTGLWIDTGHNNYADIGFTPLNGN